MTVFGERRIEAGDVACQNLHRERYAMNEYNKITITPKNGQISPSETYMARALIKEKVIGMIWEALFLIGFTYLSAR